MLQSAKQCGPQGLDRTGLSNLDFSLFKNNCIKRISENFNVQFRAEFFNILNRTNFAVPVSPTNTDIFVSPGAPTGVVRSRIIHHWPRAQGRWRLCLPLDGSRQRKQRWVNNSCF